MKNTFYPQPQRRLFALHLVGIIALTVTTLHAEPQGFLGRLGRSLFHATERLERGPNNENKPRVTSKETASRPAKDKFGRPIVPNQILAIQTTKAPLHPLIPTAPTRYQDEATPYVQLQPGGFLSSSKTVLPPTPRTATSPVVAKEKLPPHERITFDPISANPAPDVASNDPLQDTNPTAQKTPASIESPTDISRIAASRNSSPRAATAVPPVIIPFATYLSYGRVRMPFAPYHILNVEGMPSGSLARDPTSGLKFRVP
jgi:hypothetical protein